MFDIISAKKKKLLLLSIDILLIAASYIGAYLLRFDLRIPHAQYINFKNTLLPILLLKISIFSYYGLYQGMYRYTSLKDLEKVVKASLVSSGSIFLLIMITYGFQRVARSVFLIDSILTIFLIGGFRLGLRIIPRQGGKRQPLPWLRTGKVQKKRKRVLIIGAGDAGEKILREINDNPKLGYTVIGFLDDDPEKIHRSIHGVKVIDCISGLTSLVKSRDLDEIIIAISFASEKKMCSIVSLCQKTGIRCKTIPSIGELINGKINLSSIRDISYSDLLGRSPVELDTGRIGSYLGGRRVLVTGAGGSIGSECCRQIARFKPQSLIMFDRAESSLYDIEMEMKHLLPQQTFTPVLGSITSLPLLRKIFDQYQPQVIFHAAAYKHVPMIEMYPWEGVYNNIVGTKNILEMALETGAERFVLISTDKAVRPTNVMGACKRVTEIILQLKHREVWREEPKKGMVQTKIMAVRFGNVIGSAGSVIPLFKRQIARGGPLTITHPQITRYFMTINEAVQLVLQAGAMGESGDIFILKMGRPIKIIDMAKDLIQLFGFEPDKDIRIEFTGLRPGEKLYEELITEGEGIVSTSHEKLMVLRSNGSNGNNGNSVTVYSDLEKKIKELITLADRNDAQGIKLKLKEIVPEYTPEMVRGDTSSKRENIIEVVNKNVNKNVNKKVTLNYN